MMLVNRFKSKMAAKYLDFDRFCNDSGSDYRQKVHICPKNDRTIQLDHLCQVDVVIYSLQCPSGPFLQSKMAYNEKVFCISVGIFRGLIVVIYDRTMKIGIQGIFCM